MYSAGSCHHYLHSVLPCGNAAHTHNGDIHSVCHLTYHSHGNREYRRSRKTAYVVFEYRSACLYIDPHTKQGVYQRYCVGTICLNAFCDVGYARHIGRELDHKRLARSVLNSPCDLSCDCAVGSESRTPCLDIGAGNVQLDQVNSAALKHGSKLGALLNCRTCDICDYASVLGHKVWHLVFKELFNSAVLQTYRVEHTAGSFCYSRSWVALTSVKGRALDGYSAQP